jgi:hypothetical protein
MQEVSGSLFVIGRKAPAGLTVAPLYGPMRGGPAVADTRTPEQQKAQQRAQSEQTGATQDDAGKPAVAVPTVSGGSADVTANEHLREAVNKVRGSDAAPVDVPKDRPTQVVPQLGHPESSTNPVAAASGLASYPGEDHVDYVDEDGKSVNPDSIFNQPEGPQTFVTAQQRVYERFTYPGSTRQTTRLAYAPGQRISIADAEHLKATLRNIKAAT